MKNFYISLCIFILSINIFASEKITYIQTSSGKSLGAIDRGVISWEDIPYAKPPVGDLRWKAPQSFEDYDYIIRTLEDNFCIQQSSNYGGAPSDKKIVGTEDCLYLDIRAPANISANDMLPVLLWIHGGGNTSGLKDVYDFSELVRKENVIVVTINYRLGPFGWFTHPAIQDLQDGIDKTSNFGTLDIIQSLKWLKKNISKFGGNPRNITIFGESAGGHNVLSLIASPMAKGLFHKAISQSGYTTSTSTNVSYMSSSSNSSITHSSENVLEILIPQYKNYSKKEINKIIKSMPAEDFFKPYLDKSNAEIPLLTNDGIVIPSEGLKESLNNSELINNVPLLIGSNRDEVKLWLGTAKYFVKKDFSLFGSIFGIPAFTLKDPDSFEAFNYYRSSAWQIRGVLEPISSLLDAGNSNIYAYRYDWDDHRKLFFADFKTLIGAAHATEIPLLTGNNKLVGDYGFIFYPKGPSKKFTSKNMMRFWANFAKKGVPGTSTNDIFWSNFDKENKNIMILDRKKDLRLSKLDISFPLLIKELNKDSRLNNIEKCVVLYQMGSLIGNNIYEELKNYASFECEINDARNFLQKNSEYIDY